MMMVIVGGSWFRYPVACVAVTAAALLGISLTWPATGRADSCEDCHGNPQYFVQAPHINAYYRDWLGSPHKAAGVTCSRCHGGNPSAEEASEAHVGVINPTEPASSLYYRRQPDTCGQCHRPNAEQFVTSRHFEALMGAENAPTCTTCHRSMSRRPYTRDIISGACETCHGPGAEQANPDIIASAREILHRLGMAKAYLAWSLLHYQTLGWPGDSKARLEEFQAAYDASVDGIHRFDLPRSNEESIALLTELRAFFDTAWEKLQSERDAAAGDG
jgi:hypothetical protein